MMQDPHPTDVYVEPTTAIKAYSTAVFLFTWFLIAPSQWKWFPVGRAGSALVGAALMMFGGIIKFHQAMAVIGDSMEVLCLLFGLMIIANFLAKEGVYEQIELIFLWKCRNAFEYAFRVVMLSGIVSALITNDAVCIFFTPLVVRICHDHNIPFGPLLLGLGTAANIGSAATITGNPQNALIASTNMGNIGYMEFAVYMVPISLICLLINFLFLSFQFYRDLANRPLRRNPINDHLSTPILKSTFPQEINNEDEAGLLSDPETASPNISNDLLEDNRVIRALSDSERIEREKKEKFHSRVRFVCRVLTVLCTLAVFVAFFFGIPIGQASLTGAVGIIAVQGLLLRFNPNDIIVQVDYMLMIFFAGLFITVEGFNLTGYPELITDLIFSGVDLRTVLGCTLFVIVILVASNMLSNVPAVLLLAPFIHSLDPELQFPYWVISAWATTVGGNFTIIGSAANIIVAERAATTGHYSMSFKYFLYFGSWTTSIIITLGTIPLYILLLAPQNV